MSEDQKSGAPQNTNTILPDGPSELQLLKQRADQLGITYSNNIGVDTLKAKIKDRLEGTKTAAAMEPETKDSADDEHDDETCPLNEVRDENVIRRRMQEESLRLVRVRIANLNPNKKDIPGEFVTVYNKYLGTVRKFIPFGEATDNGYHVPKILLDVLKARKFVSLRTRRGKDGTNNPEQQWVKEFSIDELPPLTKEELEQLARQQAAAKGM